MAKAKTPKITLRRYTCTQPSRWISGDPNDINDTGHWEKTCGARINVPDYSKHFEEAIKFRTQTECYFPRHDMPDGSPGGTFRVLCPECGWDMEESRRSFRGGVGRSACESICQRAEGGNCSCSCGGYNHGVAS